MVDIKSFTKSAERRNGTEKQQVKMTQKEVPLFILWGKKGEKARVIEKSGEASALYGLKGGGSSFLLPEERGGGNGESIQGVTK